MTTKQDKQERMTQVTRLTYLVAQHRIAIPNLISRYLPGGEWLKQLGETGPGGTDVEIAQIQKMLELGGKLGPGTEQEGHALIKDLVHQELRNGLSQSLTVDQVSRVYQALNTLGQRAMYTEDILDLDDIELERTYLHHFQTGFRPLDIASQIGFVNSLVMILAKTGTGKTRLCLGIGEAMKKAGIVDNCFFIVNEFNTPMLKETLKPQIRRSVWSIKDGDIFRPGSGWSAVEIFDFLKSHDCENTAVFYDNPDVIATAQDEGRRFFLDNEYKVLAKCRDHCKILFVTSQARLDAPRVTMSSAIEAKAKNYWSDVVICVNKIGSTLELMVEKNRFGPVGGDCVFRYNYQELTYDEVEDEDAVWAQWTEGV